VVRYRNTAIDRSFVLTARAKHGHHRFVDMTRSVFSIVHPQYSVARSGELYMGAAANGWRSSVRTAPESPRR
jgi:hypothetical protein